MTVHKTELLVVPWMTPPSFLEKKERLGKLEHLSEPVHHFENRVLAQERVWGGGGDQRRGREERGLEERVLFCFFFCF